MKKLLIAILVIAAAYAVGAAVFAVVNGQAEGAVLNAEKQLLADGDMEESGTGDWTVGNGTITKVSGGAKDGSRILRITRGSEVSAPVASPLTPILVVGKTYRITGWARSDGNETPRVRDTGAGFNWTGTVSTAWQRIDFVGSPLSVNLQLRASAVAGTIGNYVEFDDILVTEYTGDMVNAEKQILADGDMEKSGTSDWIAGQSATLTKEVGAAEDGNQIMRITYGGATNPRMYQNILNAGTTYRLTGWARSDGSKVPRVRPTLVTIWTGTNSTEWQYLDVVFTATGPQLLIEGEGNAGYVEWDDLVLVEYTGKTIAGGKQLLADGDMEASDTSSWVAVNSPILTKEAGAAEDGDLILRVAYNGTSNPQARQNSIMTGGGATDYHLTGWARSDGTAVPQVTAGNTLFTGTTDTDWQRIDVVKAPTVSTFVLYCNIAEAGYCEYDDIVISEFQP